MVGKSIKINWEDDAKAHLKQAYNYIRRDSFKNAQKVRKDILNAVGLLPLHPERYPLDKFKINNDGSYRAFELHHLRINYRVLQTEIKIIGVRHTKMQPLEY